MPELHIITGSNGAGKSSVGPAYLPDHIKDNFTVFDGDKLALTKRKELQATGVGYKEAQSLADEWVVQQFNLKVASALATKNHFVYEGHFRESSAWKVIRKFKKNQYSIHMIFFGLINIERSAMRVLERAVSGGHNVSRPEIELNFYGNLWQLNRNYKLLDELRIIDTSEVKPQPLLEYANNVVVSRADFFDLPDWFTSNLIKITRLMYPNI